MEELSKHIPEFVDYLFKGVIAIGLYHFKDIKKSMETMTDSINKLNLGMSRMMEKHDNKDKILDEHTKDLRALRDKMHELNNEYIPKIEVNYEKIKHLEERIK